MRIRGTALRLHDHNFRIILIDFSFSVIALRPTLWCARWQFGCDCIVMRTISMIHHWLLRNFQSAHAFPKFYELRHDGSFRGEISGGLLVLASPGYQPKPKQVNWNITFFSMAT
jgi:hypothetical protein